MVPELSTDESKLPQRILIVDNDSDYRVLVKHHLKKINKQILLTEHAPVRQGLPNEAFNWSEHEERRK